MNKQSTENWSWHQIRNSRVAAPMYALFIFAGLLLLSQTGFATTTLQLNTESLVANSQSVVQGTVEKTESFVENGRVHTEVELDVKDTLKGQTRQTVTIRQIGGATDELVTRVHGVPGFETGSEVIVFLEAIPKRSFFAVTGLSQGKFTIQQSDVDGEKYVVPETEHPKLVRKASPNTNPAQRNGRNLVDAEPSSIHSAVWELEEFKGRVLDIVDRQRGAQGGLQ